MNDAQQIFMVFFAIFWGTVASVQGPWKQFNYSHICIPQTFRRILLSWAVLNFLPVAFVCWTVFSLRGNGPRLDTSTYCQASITVLNGILPAFAVFGFYRLWVAIVQLSGGKMFYRESEDTRSGARVSDKAEPTLDSLRDQLGFKAKCRYGLLNLLFAIWYFAIALAPIFWRC
ncbi:MAG: hypothetical protein H8E44_13660 [Planctomycetes bacterium]|nr:hypothetical protein [Planctomycetota bacterium]